MTPPRRIWSNYPPAGRQSNIPPASSVPTNLARGARARNSAQNNRLCFCANTLPDVFCPVMGARGSGPDGIRKPHSSGINVAPAIIKIHVMLLLPTNGDLINGGAARHLSRAGPNPAQPLADRLRPPRARSYPSHWTCGGSRTHAHSYPAHWTCGGSRTHIVTPLTGPAAAAARTDTVTPLVVSL